ncbi:MAG: hypothetical protein KatS3mg084_0400 [Candidatus Dojkabacteria bacterium]|nr:MAG: hypothetical protein KatS3mg084_0400 [Candidatus Dojkabacteria bacterium]
MRDFSSLYKLVGLFLFLFVYFLLQDNKVFAVDFKHDIKAIYEINENGSTNVKYEFVTSNQVANNYLKKFEFLLPFEPEGLDVSKSPTRIEVVQLNKSSNTGIYKLVVEFVEPVIGQNKTFQWQISFRIKDILINHGIQKAILIPTFSENDPSITFDISVRYPKSIGDVAYVYGNADVESDGEYDVYHFYSKNNLESSIVFLIGRDADYEFELKDGSQIDKIFLPYHTKYQSVYYENFRSDIESLKFENNFIYINNKQDTALKGYIKTTDSDEDVYHQQNTYKYRHYTYLDEIAKTINKENKKAYDIAKDIYIQVLKRFKINDYKVNSFTTNSITENKFDVNVVELNYIYRNILEKFDIESRGVFGYVFPIQPLKRDTFITYQHVWTEFWDGSKWVVVDPAWYLSSGGTIYFDNNNYHHIKFGHYYDESEISDFFKQEAYFIVKPLTQVYKPLDIDKKLELKIDSYSSLNQNLTLEFHNHTSQIIQVSKIDISTNIDSLRSDFDEISSFLIPPESKIRYPIKLESDISITKRNADINVSAQYTSSFNLVDTATVKKQLEITTNISRYLVFVYTSVLIGVCVFLFISMVSLRPFSGISYY